MRFKKIKLNISISLISVICSLLCTPVNTHAYNDNQTLYNNQNMESHIADDIFDGYDGVEINTLGKVGYNHAFEIQEIKSDLILEYNQNIASDLTNTEEIFGLGRGWKIKIPYVEINDSNMYYCSEEGYRYLIEENDKGYDLVNYPGEHSFAIDVINDAECYILNLPYGEQKFFSEEGKILIDKDAYGNEIQYKYDSQGISSIVYPNGTTIIFERSNNSIKLKIKQGDTERIAATLIFRKLASNMQQLSSIQEENGKYLQFEYNNGLLTSFDNSEKFKRTINYESTENPIFGTYSRIKSLNTVYNSGDNGTKTYTYDSAGRLETINDDDIAVIHYQYILDGSGNRTVKTNKSFENSISTTSETVNNTGQLTNYTTNGNILELRYNSNNQVEEEIENSKKIRHKYSEKGRLQSVILPDGTAISYSYDSNGILQTKSVGNTAIYYDETGNIKKILKDGSIIFSDKAEKAISSKAAAVSVLYHINNQVSVTNYHTYYGLQQSGFNCYTFAIGKTTRIADPGYYSNRDLPLSSISGIKLNVEKDQESLSRTIYDTTVNASIPDGHCWKIALRIRPSEDYHFMKINYGSGKLWQFKDGRNGPVMQLRTGYTPSNASWDTYGYNSSLGKYIVLSSGYYNSARYYMMIRE